MAVSPGNARERSPRRLGSRRHKALITDYWFPMVYLSRIYTKTGDAGDTGLGDGRRVPKDHPRVEAVGGVDELNSILGLLLAQAPDLSEHGLVQSIQNDL